MLESGGDSEEYSGRSIGLPEFDTNPHTEIMEYYESMIESTSSDTSETAASESTLRDEVNFIQNVSQFYNQEMLSDVVIKIGEQKFYAHKFVLAKSSEVFMKMLYERAWSQNVTEELILNESPECESVFDAFLKYLYYAEVNINISTAVGILCLSDKYNVSSLKSLCVEYMVENCRSPKVTNALNWYSWSKVLHLEKLIEQCTKTVMWNAHDIINSPEWLMMELDFLKDLLHSSELVVTTEFALWEAVSSWLLFDTRISALKDNAKVLMPLIRFPQMQAAQLYSLERSNIYQKDECKDLMHSLLSQAYRFRALCPTQSSLGVSFKEKYYLPRDYTDLTVDSVQMQNALRFGIQVDVKMYRGPVPVENRDGDWKITYRKTPNGVWQLQLYGHETAMVNSEARVQPSVLIYNEQDKVIQVHQHPLSIVGRGNCISINLDVNEPDLGRKLSLLIKTIPS